MLGIDLVKSQINEQEVERQMIILREDLTTTSDYKEKLEILVDLDLRKDRVLVLIKTIRHW